MSFLEGNGGVQHPAFKIIYLPCVPPHNFSMLLFPSKKDIVDFGPRTKAPRTKSPSNNEKYKLMFFVSNISVSLFNCSDM
jgi:hypothetical protein